MIKLTGRPYKEILNLAQTGAIQGHQTRRGHWRLNVDAVEEYFGIQINNPDEVSKEQESIKSPIKLSIRNKDNIYISGQTARRYLKCSKAEFESLVDQGIIQAHRDEHKRWRVLKESILSNQIQPKPSYETHLIINENHYQDVIQRICTAKSSIRIMTANFKRFNLKPTDSQGEGYKDGTPFVKYLMAKAVQGVSVQIICSKPSSFFMDEWQEYFQQMKPDLFEYKFCERNHAKVVIVDDIIAYVGSANVTPAGLGQGIFTPGNFEAGILTEKQDIISSLKALFSIIMDGDCCTGCHRVNKCKSSE